MSDSPRKLVVLNEPITRRKLLETSAAGLVAALALPLATACCGPPDDGDGGYDGGPDGGDGLDGGGRRDGGTPNDGGGCPTSPNCTVDANTLILPLAQYPELVPVLGWNVYFDQRYTDPVCQGDAILVIQVSQGKYVALSGSCTHACCTVQLDSDGSGFLCPCHGSFYNLEGELETGPATLNLPSLPVCFDGCAVYVQLG
jgi:Rieske Fe-S protein